MSYSVSFVSTPRPQRPSTLANKTSLHLRLTVLSSEKLDHESSAREPNLRRCLGHASIHEKSMQMVQQDIMHHLRSMAMGDGDDDADEIDREKRAHRLHRRRSSSPTKRSPSPPPVISVEGEKTSLLDRGRQYVESLFSRRSSTNTNPLWSRSRVVTC
ncbi:hypothetical protein ASPZODRAFT_136396 [Penicilliopsis zonata CBS 506.65]|uniref:Uncharacterized protein n=1 Tax=Penicilliopsis zonata CBS 506.65 TaxID=1073090 RepID=A0A1L9S7R7_9EURO|nr:hypothetical protein ASPZODRAFT_136396 [Penicilliopsis zonata CBS 506.65]OJJ43200.1 hypothetical protein ASPZODRAFT_136396 [Penicilliopsis zonata CBS 506.65]